MKKALIGLYNRLGRLYLKPLLNAEIRKRPFPEINERATEYSFTIRQLQKHGSGTVLDVGPGKSSWPHIISTCGFDVTAIDKIDGYWNNYFNRHYKVISDDVTASKLGKKFQFATCLSVLEHIPDHEAAVKGMHDLLEPGGFLVLTFPYNENIYHPNVYKDPEAGYGQEAKFVTQIYSRAEINSWLYETTFEIVEQEYYQAFTGKLWTFGNRVVPCRKVENSELHHLTCILLKRN